MCGIGQIDMIRPADNFYLSKEEPIKSCLLALRSVILKYNGNFTEEWKYGMPVFCLNGKMFCYLWVRKKTMLPYLGIVEGRKIDNAKLLQENRSRMKILLINPEEDLPVKTIYEIFGQLIPFYQRR